MSITVRALTLTLMLFLQLFWGPLPPKNRTFRHPNLATKDLRDLLNTALRSREMFERESTIVTGGEGVSEAAYFDKHLIELLIICFYTTIHIN